MVATVRVADSEEGLLMGGRPVRRRIGTSPTEIPRWVRGNARQDRQSFFLRALNLP